MSQVPKLRRPQVTPNVQSVGTTQSDGPSAGGVFPASLDDYEIIDGTYVLYYKGGKIGTAYELVKIDGK